MTAVVLMVKAFFCVTFGALVLNLSLQTSIFANALDDVSPHIFSKADLTQSDILLLSVCGNVFDVSSGERFYGTGGSYELFGRKDATRALATANMSDENLTDDVSSLSGEECIAAEGWLKYFRDHETYEHRGVLHGHFYNENGLETEGMRRFKQCVINGRQIEEGNENITADRYKGIDPPECDRIVRESDRMHIVSCDAGYTPRKSYFTAGHSMNPDGTSRSINIISCVCLELHEANDRHDLQLYHDDCHPHGTECVFNNHEHDIHH